MKAPIRLLGKGLFSTVAKPGMFGLGMVSKENFLAYSTQFISLIIRLVPGNVVMVAIDMCGKSPIMGKWIYGITWKHVLAFTFLVYLFDSLIIFLHFYICIVWFVLANNRILVFILKLLWSDRLVVKALDSQSRVPCSKTLGGSKVDSAFHPFEVDKMSTRNFWELSGKK